MSPILDYAAGAWSVGITDCTKLDRVQLRACRFYLGLPKNATLLGIIGEMGWCPGVVRRDIEVLRLFNTICGQDDSRLTKRLLKYDKNRNGLWSQNVNAICETLERPESWEQLYPVNLQRAKEVLLVNYQDTWRSELSSKPKLELLSKIRNDISTGFHVTSRLNKGQRSLISQIKLGCLPLQIEVGHFSGTPREDRICTLCNNGEVESEVHFLFDCDWYAESRLSLYHKLPELLNYIDKSDRLRVLCSTPYTMGNYLTKIWRERTEALNSLKSAK